MKNLVLLSIALTLILPVGLLAYADAAPQDQQPVEEAVTAAPDQVETTDLCTVEAEGELFTLEQAFEAAPEACYPAECHSSADCGGGRCRAKCCV